MDIETSQDTETSETLFSSRFLQFVQSNTATQATASLADGSEIEFHITGSNKEDIEVFHFRRVKGENTIHVGAASQPQFVFTLTPRAAEEVLALPIDELNVGQVGIELVKLILSPDANKRITIKLKSGIFGLFTQGYFGILTAGGSAFAAFLATKGFNGIGAIKSAISKLKG